MTWSVLKNDFLQEYCVSKKNISFDQGINFIHLTEHCKGK